MNKETDTPPTPALADEKMGLSQFLEALGGDVTGLKIDEPDPTEPPVQDDGPTDKKPLVKPKKFKELGAYAKLTDDELYGIEVPSAIEGQAPYTLGKLKDLAKDHDEFTLNGLQREQSFRDREAKLLRTEQELRDILGAIPEKAIPEKVRAELQTRRTRAETEERQRVLSVIPEWQDREVRTSELGAMIEHLQDHGFPEGYLANVLDHRTLRYIRSNMVRERNLKAALAKVQAHKPKTPAKGNKSSAPTKPANANGGRPASREQTQHDRFSNVLFANNQSRS
jgi:hypothetical protein